MSSLKSGGLQVASCWIVKAAPPTVMRPLVQQYAKPRENYNKRDYLIETVWTLFPRPLLPKLTRTRDVLLTPKSVAENPHWKPPCNSGRWRNPRNGKSHCKCLWFVLMERLMDFWLAQRDPWGVFSGFGSSSAQPQGWQATRASWKPVPMLAAAASTSQAWGYPPKYTKYSVRASTGTDFLTGSFSCQIQICSQDHAFIMAMLTGYLMYEYITAVRKYEREADWKVAKYMHFLDYNYLILRRPPFRLSAWKGADSLKYTWGNSQTHSNQPWLWSSFNRSLQNRPYL